MPISCFLSSADMGGKEVLSSSVGYIYTIRSLCFLSPIFGGWLNSLICRSATCCLSSLPGWQHRSQYYWERSKTNLDMLSSEFIFTQNLTFSSHGATENTEKGEKVPCSSLCALCDLCERLKTSGTKLKTQYSPRGNKNYDSNSRVPQLY